MNILLRALAVCLAMGTVEAVCDPGPWKVVTFPVDAGIVSSVAIGGGRVAVGFTGGAVVVVDTGTAAASTSDREVGAGGRILSMDWFEGDIWAATTNGLSRYAVSEKPTRRGQDGMPIGIGNGVKAVKTQAGALWCATSRKLARVGAQGKNRLRQWDLPVECEPTVILKVAGRILVGTGNKGLFVLDTATERWVRYGVSDGLSSDQITAMEWMGDQILVGTSEGLDAVDLSSLQSRRLAAGVAISWMTQVNGAVFATTFDGLLRIDPWTLETKGVELPERVQAEGDLAFAEGVLAVGCANALAIRQQPTFLGFEAPRAVPQGFRVSIPKALPPQVRLQALLRLPEWPAAKVPVTVTVQEDGRDVLLATPPETKGRIQIDFLAMAGNRVLETRSMDGDGDRAKPTLLLDPVATITNRQELTLSGVVSGVGPLALSLEPSNRILSMGAMGQFRHRVVLGNGENRLALQLVDGLGSQLRRELVVRFDDKPPQILSTPWDTVVGASARVRVPFRDESEVKVSVEPADGSKLSMFDSFVVLESRELEVGDNSWLISFKDEAGNASSVAVHVWKTPNPLDSIASSGTTRTGAGRGQPKDSARRTGMDTTKNAIHVIRYRMEKDDDIRGVAKNFYGVKEMDAILVRWNGLENAKVRLPKGSVLEIPMWKGFEYGLVDPAEALRHFPWGELPAVRKTSK